MVIQLPAIRIPALRLPTRWATLLGTIAGTILSYTLKLNLSPTIHQVVVGVGALAAAILIHPSNQGETIEPTFTIGLPADGANNTGHLATPAAAAAITPTVSS